MYTRFIYSLVSALAINSAPAFGSPVPNDIVSEAASQVSSSFNGLQGSGSSSGYVRLDFNVLKGLDFGSALKGLTDTINSLLPRDDEGGNKTQTVGLSNEKSFYVSSLKIGSNKDEVKVLVDTGSSDLWVMSAKNPHCNSNGGNIDCDKYGTYNETASSTFQSNSSDFSINYMDNTYASGVWGQDDITLNDDFTLNGANFAVADNSDSDTSVFGISYKTAESSKGEYDNLPIQMKQQGYINKIAYSLYLTGSESEKGTILFGGIDHAKYEGELSSIDISKSNDELLYLQIPLTSVSVNITSNETANTGSDSNSQSPSSSSSSGSPISGLLNGVSSLASSVTNPSKSSESSSKAESSSSLEAIDVGKDAILDSGTTLSFLSQKVVDKIIDNLQPGAKYDNSYGGYIVSCTLRQPGNSINFLFNNEKEIAVSTSDAIIDAGTDSKTGKKVCMLGIVPNDQIILGDNFLRSAYTVFNLDDAKIQIAQIKHSDSEDIEAIQ
ncbi:acid protease [Hyphopichia burtonii NRRL Y-1933]|uniref:candidapepsin n=1 Tax=Hyphopichia burtonii NRRL Y-1933 TaxID=984485 RepID=A0A1E4RF22_9ASCO|nr:acid protease [Hyphopichia burtonii NRRL Y-1933]ODV65858.1 acid protease [Hyphopichia burtonii NRRL Y-1933]